MRGAFKGPVKDGAKLCKLEKDAIIFALLKEGALFLRMFAWQPTLEDGGSVSPVEDRFISSPV